MEFKGIEFIMNHDNKEINELENQKEDLLVKCNATYSMLLLLKSAFDKEYTGPTSQKMQIRSILKDRLKKLHRQINEVDTSMSLVRSKCCHDLVDISDDYDNHSIYRCKHCGDYRR